MHFKNICTFLLVFIVGTLTVSHAAHYSIKEMMGTWKRLQTYYAGIQAFAYNYWGHDFGLPKDQNPHDENGYHLNSFFFQGRDTTIAFGDFVRHSPNGNQLPYVDTSTELPSYVYAFEDSEVIYEIMFRPVRIADDKKLQPLNITLSEALDYIPFIGNFTMSDYVYHLPDEPVIGGYVQKINGTWVELRLIELNGYDAVALGDVVNKYDLSNMTTRTVDYGHGPLEVIICPSTEDSEDPRCKALDEAGLQLIAYLREHHRLP